MQTQESNNPSEQMSEWTDYTQVGQLPVGEYLWRMPHAYLDIVVVFRAKVRMRGHGYRDDVASPDFDHWDGYIVHIPPGAQCRDVRDDDPLVHVEGIELLPCPFCGQAPRWKAGGGYIGARPNKHDRFELGHCIAEVHREDPRHAAAVWNTRAGQSVEG